MDISSHPESLDIAVSEASAKRILKTFISMPPGTIPTGDDIRVVLDVLYNTWVGIPKRDDSLEVVLRRFSLSIIDDESRAVAMGVNPGDVVFDYKTREGKFMVNEEALDDSFKKIMLRFTLVMTMMMRAGYVTISANYKINMEEFREKYHRAIHSMMFQRQYLASMMKANVYTDDALFSRVGRAIVNLGGIIQASRVEFDALCDPKHKNDYLHARNFCVNYMVWKSWQVWSHVGL